MRLRCAAAAAAAGGSSPKIQPNFTSGAATCLEYHSLYLLSSHQTIDRKEQLRTETYSAKELIHFTPLHPTPVHIEALLNND